MEVDFEPTDGERKRPPALSPSSLEVEGPMLENLAACVDSQEAVVQEVDDFLFAAYLRSSQHGSSPLERQLETFQHISDRKQDNMEVGHASSPMEAVLSSRKLVALIVFFSVVYICVFYSLWPFPARTPIISAQYLRFTATSLRSRADPTSPNIESFGLLHQGCSLALSNRTVAGATMTMSGLDGVPADGWWLQTSTEVSAEEDPVVFVLEASDDGHSWTQVGGSSWTVCSNLRIGFGRAAFATPTARGKVVHFDHRVPWFWVVGKIVGDAVLSGRLMIPLTLALLRRARLAKLTFLGTFYVSAGTNLVAALAFALHGWTLGAVERALHAGANLLLATTIDGGVEVFVPSLTGAGAVVTLWEVIESSVLMQSSALFWGDTPVEGLLLLVIGCGLAVSWIWIKYRAWLRVRADQLPYDEVWQQLLHADGAVARVAELQRVAEAMGRKCHDRREARNLNRVRAPHEGWQPCAGGARTNGAGFVSRPPLDHRSPVTCLEQLLCQATALHPIFRCKVQAWAMETRGCVPVLGSNSGKLEFKLWAEVGRESANRHVWAGVKRRERAMLKLLSCYRKDPSRLLDVCRQRLVFENMRDLTDALQVINLDPDVRMVRVTNRMDKHYDPSLTAGYRDVKINLRLETPQTWEYGLDTHVCELQLVLLDFAALQSRESHRRFQHYRLSRPAESSKWAWAGMRLLRWLSVLTPRRSPSPPAPRTASAGGGLALSGEVSHEHLGLPERFFRSPAHSADLRATLPPRTPSPVHSSCSAVVASVQPEPSHVMEEPRASASSQRRRRGSTASVGIKRGSSESIGVRLEVKRGSAVREDLCAGAFNPPPPPRPASPPRLRDSVRRCRSAPRTECWIEGPRRSLESAVLPEEESTTVDVKWLREHVTRLTCVPHTELHDKVSDVADAVGRASTDSLVFTSRPLAAGISRFRWQLIMILLSLYSLGFGCWDFWVALSGGGWRYAQYRLSPLQLRDGTEGAGIAAPNVAGLGLMRDGCAVDGAGVWTVQRQGERLVLRLLSDEEQAFDGWWFTTGEASADLDPVQFTLHASTSTAEVVDEAEWELVGMHSYRCVIGGLVPFHNLAYPTPARRGAVVEFDMRPPPGYMLTMVHNRIVAGVFLGLFALSGVLRRVRYANWIFATPFFLASMLLIIGATSYLLDSIEHRAEVLYWFLFAPASLSLAVVAVAAERHLIVTATLKGAYLVALDVLYTSLAYKDISLFLVAPPIVGFLFLGAGLLALGFRFRSLRRSRALISLDMAKYNRMWEHLVGHPASHETIAFITSLVARMVTHHGANLSRQYNRRQGGGCPSLSSRSASTDTAHTTASSASDRGLLDSRAVEASLHAQADAGVTAMPLGGAPAEPAALLREGSGVLGRLSRTVSLSSLKQSFKGSLAAWKAPPDGERRGSRRWATWGWMSGVWRQPGLLVDTGAPVDSLDQLYFSALALQPLLRRKVQQWALQSRGYFPAGAAGGGGESPLAQGRGGSVWSTSTAGGASEAEDGSREAMFTLWEAAAEDAVLERDIKWGRIKKPQRAVEKLLRSYEQDVSRLVDVSRESIVFDSLEDLASCLEAISKDPQVCVVRVKNKLEQRYNVLLTAGYRDVSVNLRIETAESAMLRVDNHVCEVQLLLKAFAILKNEDGHARYIRFRNDRAE